MKGLGQHFLKNKSAIKKIVDSLEIKLGDSIVEIGPGHGELTERLLAFSCELLEKNSSSPIKVIAIEKDRSLIQHLREKFIKEKNLELICGDALKLLPQIIDTYNLKAKSYKLVGNIPYYITGRILRILSELKKKPEISVLTIQKEVAERITAKPPQMNRLAAIVQFWAEPKIISLLPKEDFDPQPQVSSAIVKLKNIARKESKKSLHYYKTVKILFAQPRKTILNNISFGIKELRDKKPKNIHARAAANQKEGVAEELKKINIDPSGRPQDLSVEEILRISSIY